MGAEQHNAYLTGSALIRNENGELLLVRQEAPSDPHPSWALPGGRCEGDESILNGITREAREEAGIECRDFGATLFTTHVYHTEQAMHEIAFTIRVTQWSKVQAIEDPDDLVDRADFLSDREAIRRLEDNPFRVIREPILDYLNDRIARGAMYHYRNGPDDVVRLNRTPDS